MSKKTIIIILSILFALIVVLFGAAFIISFDKGVPAGEVLRDFLPFGKGSEEISRDFPSPPPATNDEKDGDDVSTPSLPREEAGVLGLKKLTAHPIAGATTDKSVSGDTIRIYYIEQETGNVFSVFPKTGSVERLTLTTIPGMREIIWGESALVARYLDEEEIIKSFSASIAAVKKAETPQELTGAFLEDDISEMVASPSGNQIFSLSLSGNSTVGTIANFDGSGRRQVINLRHGEWLPGWEESKTITLTRRASASVLGFSYFLNVQSGALQKTLGNIPGLTTKTAPDAKTILYGESAPNTYKTFVYKVGAEEKSLFPLATFPEKCVWGSELGVVLYCGAPETFPQGVYPDDWYMGVISLSDSIWKINNTTGTVEFLSFPKQAANEDIDLVNPFLSTDESYLFFTNKKDSSLWSLRLK